MALFPLIDLDWKMCMRKQSADKTLQEVLNSKLFMVR